MPTSHPFCFTSHPCSFYHMVPFDVFLVKWVHHISCSNSSYTSVNELPSYPVSGDIIDHLIHYLHKLCIYKFICYHQLSFPFPSQLGPTMERDRSGDRVYEFTMEVVRNIMGMVNDIHTVKSDQYVNLVKVSTIYVVVTCCVWHCSLMTSSLPQRSKLFSITVLDI